jgi:hypothetical protein
MTPALRQLLRAYVSRRSPWGPPWWIYGVAYGAANLVRQAVAIIATPEMSTPARVGSWAATALLVIGIVNAAAAVVRRHEARKRAAATAPALELARSAIGPKEEAA